MSLRAKYKPNPQPGGVLSPLFKTVTDLVMTILAVVTFIALALNIPALREPFVELSLLIAFISSLSLRPWTDGVVSGTFDSVHGDCKRVCAFRDVA